jgi:TP901 family phage tail tape measure protein
MASEVFQLYLLLTLKDYASGGMNRVEAQLRGMGKEGRAALKTFQALREDLKRDLGTAAIGVGVLTAMSKGVKVAGNFEASVSDLRMRIAELGDDGQVNVQKLNSELGKLEALGVRVGNRLPGSTQDFVEMFSTLKEGGLAATTIIDGAGESVAHLAVVTNEIPKDLAEPFAQYAQQFALTGDEAIKLSETLAKIRFATGLRPGELIEGSKFFQLRAGLPLGLTGLQGANISGRLLATLRSYGLEGGIGGRELGGFMLSLNFNTKEKQKLIKELQKKGIDLQFFDKKGGFLGVENVFKQMEKMRSLSTQDQMKFGEKLFDREGMAIASVFMKSGLEGWSKINQKIDKVLPLQELINQKTATYNAKLETVKGTLENLAVSSFTPMLDEIKPLLDSTNELTGWLQQIVAAHPGVAGTLGEFVGLSGIALTLVGTLRAGTTAWGLYSIAASSARLQLAGAAAEGGKLKGTLNTLAGMKTIRLTVQFLVAGYAIEQILKWKAEYDEQQKNFAEKSGGVGTAYDQALSAGKLYQPAATADKDYLNKLAQQSLDAMKMGRGLELDLEPDRAGFFEHFWTSQRPYTKPWDMPLGGLGGLYDFVPQLRDNFTRPFSSDVFAKTYRGSEAIKPLQDPNVLAQLLLRLKQGEMGLSSEGRNSLMQGIEKALAGVTTQEGKPVYGEAVKLADAELAKLSEQAKQLGSNLQNVSNWFGPTNQLPVAFQRAGDAATRFSLRVNTLELAQPSFSGPGPQSSPQAPAFQINRPFTFQKSSLTSQAERAVHHHTHGPVSLRVRLPAGATAANDPAELARLLAYEIEIQGERA